MLRLLLLLGLVVAAPALRAQDCSGTVFDDRDADGVHDAREPGLPGIRVSNGVDIATTDRAGRYRLAVGAAQVFVIKPAGFEPTRRADGLPAYWQAAGEGGCPAFGLHRTRRRADLDVLVMSDPQPKSDVDVGYYERDIVEPLRREGDRPAADLGLTLGDIVNDVPGLYPRMIAATVRLGAPWLHVAGNHDVDAHASTDADALATFHRTFGPDTFAWEEPQADFVLLDDVISMPGHKPAYVGGLRDDQFRFLEHYLPTHDPRRLLVIGVHIPLFPDGGETFRTADRERLFAVLRDVPRVLVLSGHGHVQRHVFHDASTGWHGTAPLHEYNLGAACGAYWSGAKDAEGIPDATMADGTPNGTARLRVDTRGAYTLAWQPARTTSDHGPLTRAMRVHAPRVLRHGAYPAWGVYANVWMGTADERVEYRVDGGDWQPMKRVLQPDPWLMAENVRDDGATALRGYDRSPEAEPSTHLWRGALPTSLAIGEHRVEIRAQDPWQGEQRGDTTYRLEDAAP